MSGGPTLPPRSLRSLELLHLSYYHPHLKSMDDVRNLLVPHLHENGHFIVRNSFSKPDTITVSVMHGKSIKHFNIGRNPDGFYLQDRLFPTLDKLVKCHADEDVPNVEGVQKVRLVTPISVADCEMDPCSRRNPGSYGSYPNLRREPVQHSWSGSSGGSTMPRASERMSIDVNSNVFEGNDVQSPPSSGTSSSPWKSPFTKIFKRGKSKDPIPKPLVADVRKSADEVLIQRAPPPVPKDERANSTGGSGSSGGSEGVYDRGLYSRIDQRTDKSSMLADALRQHDPTTTCECGLELEDSELPRSWSVHISREPSTTGRIFFEGPQGQTCWNLPLDVSTELSLKQQEFIRKLLLDVRAGKLPPAPNLQGEAASVDSAGKTSIGAFNNSRSSSSSEGSGGMVARGVSPPGSRRSSSQRGYSGGADPATSDGRGAEGAVSTGDSPSYLTRQGNATMRPTNTSL